MNTILAAAAAGLLAAGICFAASPLGRALGVVDHPDDCRKRHEKPTPMVGGIAVAGPVLAVLFALSATSTFAPLYLTMAVVLAGFLVLGLVDDRSHLRPVLRLSLSVLLVLAILLVVPAERVMFFRFTFLEYAVFLPPLWSLLFTVLCLVGLQNAVNMADGRNGLALGLMLIWTLLAVAYAPPHVLPVLGALAAALAVTLAFNLRGRLFLGDSGTYALSVGVGLLAIHIYNLEFAALHADVVALWFLIPVVDAIRLMLFRLMVGLSPFRPDVGHFHHMLARRMPWRWGLAAYLALVAAPALVALAEPAAAVPAAAVALALYGWVVVASFWDPARRRMRLGLQGPA
jgi:UDP-GlcNAc:undecaprenyl-phosphate GlcNAc-1-phosphate transferase